MNWWIFMKWWQWSLPLVTAIIHFLHWTWYAKICNIILIISFSLKYKMLTMLQNSILQHNYSTLCDGSQTHLSLRYLTSTALLAVCKSQSCPLHRTWHLNIHVILHQCLIGCRTILEKTSTQMVRQSTQNIYLHNQ